MSAITDTVADLLTRLRNASRAGHRQVEIPASNVKIGIVKILAEERFIHGYQVFDDGLQGLIRVYLKYTSEREPALVQLERISRPGLRKYCGYRQIPRVRNGLGIAILSTNRGVMCDRDARRQKLGGELLCYAW